MKDWLEELSSNKEYLISELIGQFCATKIPSVINVAVSEIEQCGDIDNFIDLLNNLLINPHHRSHQYVARLIQEQESPSSIPYIKQVIDSGFVDLEYTCSEPEVIAKWFSHALAAIGTDEAINLMRNYTESTTKGIRDEMKYRLDKIESLD